MRNVRGTSRRGRLLVAMLLSAMLPAAGSVGLRAADRFVRGDANGSGGIAVPDAIVIFRYLFAGAADAVRCQDAADADDDGDITVADAIYILSALFRRGPAPRPPWPGCDADPTEDALACEKYEVCATRFQFFGFDFEGDGVFFVIDRSGTFTDTGGLGRAKAELVEAIERFPDGTQLGFVFVSSGVIKWPTAGEPATLDSNLRDTAVEFVQSIRGGSGSCVEAGLQVALSFAEQSTVSPRDVIYVGDGGGTCAGTDEGSYLKKTVTEITAANHGLAHLHTILVGIANGVNEQFLRDLAGQNGGTFHHVE